MAGNVRFHSKYHSKSHHTVSTPGYFDSGADPIASYSDPFQGDFVLNGSLSAKNILAGTFFVSVLSAGTFTTGVKAVTGNYTVLNSDQIILAHGGVSGSSLMLPSASAVQNQTFTIKRTSTSSAVAVSAVGSDLIEQQYTSVNLTSAYYVLQFVAFGNAWWLLQPEPS